MGALGTNDKRYNEIINKYKRVFETAKISMAYEYGGIVYKQILFKKALGKHTCGTLIITNDGEVVYDKKITSQLEKYFYYIERLVNTEYIKSLSKTILTDKQKQNEIQNNKKILFALNALRRDNLDGIDIVIDVFNEIPDNKIENNKCVLEFIDKVNEYDKKDTIFNKQIIDDIFLQHKKTLMKNHERVKLINRGRNYYDEIKRQISGKNVVKRLSKGRDFTVCAYTLEYAMDYFRNMLTLYDKIVDLTENQYDKYLENMESKKLEERLKLSRG